MASLSATQRVAITLVCLTVGSVALYWFDPATTSWLPQCPIHQLTGLDCPGCGTTRMLHLLLRGHPLLALRQNALTLMLLPVLLYVLLRSVGQGIAPTLTRCQTSALLLLAGAFMIARNLPAWGCFKI